MLPRMLDYTESDLVTRLGDFDRFVVNLHRLDLLLEVGGVSRDVNRVARVQFTVSDRHSGNVQMIPVMRYRTDCCLCHVTLPSPFASFAPHEYFVNSGFYLARGYNRNMAGVNGRVALVTGGSRGIGRATAELLASRGARVMCVARSKRQLAASGFDYTVADLGTAEGCAKAVAETEQRLGPVDILICNHGIGSAHERVLWEQQPEDWDETMRINLGGPFHLSRLVLLGMTERGYGRLVFTSSTAGLVAEHAGSAYNSSKHGLIGLMRSAARDGGAFGVTANAVLPGWVRTEMAERSARQEANDRGITPDQVWKERAALYPPGRVATCNEVAELIAFFASEESSGVSGEAVRVALGGQS